LNIYQPYLDLKETSSVELKLNFNILLIDPIDDIEINKNDFLIDRSSLISRAGYTD
jgi:hypothetical protein